MDFRKIISELSANDYEMIIEFEQEHEKHREQFGDVSAALFTYTIIPTGLGTIVTIECGCGEALHLGGFLDADPYTTMSKKCDSDITTERVDDLVETIRIRPGLVLKSFSFASFWYWLMGISTAISMMDDNSTWLKVNTAVEKTLVRRYGNGIDPYLKPEDFVSMNGSDEEAFRVWYEVYDEVKAGFLSSK